MDFSTLIISWYNQNKRDLPWRKTKDPYKIWLSEIMLQQTRVEQGLPYYLKFIKNFPKISDLASAPEEKILMLWQGLGYYSRARNLHFTAKNITNNLDGKFPSSYDEIIKLKGIGEYTAAAIASFSFNEHKAVVDGNVIRVLTRYFGIKDDISSSSTIKSIKQLATELLPTKNSDTYNQGIMEFGALQCKPKSPNCEICPLNKSCKALKEKIISTTPFKSKKIKTRNRYFNYLVYKQKDNFFMKQRSEKDIWQNLYDFPLIESDNLLNFDDELIIKHVSKYISINDVKINSSQDYKHILSHQIIHARFFVIELKQEVSELINEYKITNVTEVENFGKPILIQNYLNKYIL